MKKKGQVVKGKRKMGWKVLLVVSLALSQLGLVSAAFANDSRDTASVSFPNEKSVFETDEILENYESYLRYVVEVGKQVDRSNTQRLLKVYSNLRKRSPEHAAVFLKGLRFEMISKADLMGGSGKTLSSSSPEMRRWVGRYIKEWVREADEHLFRSFTARNQVAKRD